MWPFRVTAAGLNGLPAAFPFSDRDGGSIMTSICFLLYVFCIFKLTKTGVYDFYNQKRKEKFQRLSFNQHILHWAQEPWQRTQQGSTRPPGEGAIEMIASCQFHLFCVLEFLTFSAIYITCPINERLHNKQCLHNKKWKFIFLQVPCTSRSKYLPYKFMLASNQHFRVYNQMTPICIWNWVWRSSKLSREGLQGPARVQRNACGSLHLFLPSKHFRGPGRPDSRMIALLMLKVVTYLCDPKCLCLQTCLDIVL